MGAYSGALNQAFSMLYQQGVVAVAAAGNRGGPYIIYPARFPSVLSVSAIGEDTSLASFSSYGEYIDVAAPGVNVTSLDSCDAYRTWSGTSFSAPFVAGAAALYLQLHPFSPNHVVYWAIRNGAQIPKGYAKPWNAELGYGIIDLRKLLGL
jgi:subtilisin family serine protease